MSERRPARSMKYALKQSVRPTIAPLSAAIGGVLAAGSLQAATITVTTLQDGFIPGECTLRSAINAATLNAASDACIAGAAGVDRIEFDPGLSGTISLLAGESGYYDGSTLPIGESITIDGGDRITVEGTGDAPVFYAKYDPGTWDTEVTRFENITITGGGGNRGGGILSRGRELRLSNTDVVGNSAVTAGGGIWHNHPTSDISRFYISGNSTIESNQTTGASSRGGGIYVGGESATVQISQSTIAYNTSFGSGGGIERRVSVGGLRFYNSEVYNNTAKYGNGGGVNSISEAPGIGTSFFARNTEFRNNNASENGGGLALYDTGTGINNFGRFVFRGATLSGNVAGNVGGGAWLVRGDGSGTAADPVNSVVFEENTYSNRRSLITGNESATSAAGIYISVGNATDVTFTGVDIEYNVANDGNGAGAVVFAGDAGLGLSDTRFQNNTVAAGGAGGGLYAAINGGDFAASQVSFIDNAAQTGAGGARVNSTGGEIGFIYAEFRNNDSASFGGGLQIYGNPSQVSMGYSVVSGNSSVDGGGGMDLYVPGISSGLMEIKYSEFSENSAGNSGGAISLNAGSGSQMIIENSTISTNSASNLGGGLYSNAGATLDLKYSTVANNYAGSEGGGLFTDMNNGCQIDNTILAGNTATAGAEGQDLRIADGSTECNADHSLLSGKYSEFTNGTGNILFQDPLLGPLADNGGLGGRTHALLQGSPAIDAGNAGATVGDYDQRGAGFDRIFGAGLDMGAYEQQVIVDSIFSDRFQTP